MKNDLVPKLYFTTPFDEREAYEVRAWGYLAHVQVALENVHHCL